MCLFQVGGCIFMAGPAAAPRCQGQRLSFVLHFSILVVIRFLFYNNNDMFVHFKTILSVFHFTFLVCMSWIFVLFLFVSYVYNTMHLIAQTRVEGSVF